MTDSEITVINKLNNFHDKTNSLYMPIFLVMISIFLFLIFPSERILSLLGPSMPFIIAITLYYVIENKDPKGALSLKDLNAYIQTIPVDLLIKLAKSQEIGGFQRGLIVEHLNKKQPGWSLG